jgi:hypothetical protein
MMLQPNVHSPLTVPDTTTFAVPSGRIFRSPADSSAASAADQANKQPATAATGHRRPVIDRRSPEMVLTSVTHTLLAMSTLPLFAVGVPPRPIFFLAGYHGEINGSR